MNPRGFASCLAAVACGSVLALLGGSASASGSYTCTITGTPGADFLGGSGGRDVICGLGGNDVIAAGGGNDVLNGGSGNDKLEGDAGRDLMLGGPGRDTFLAYDGYADTIDGGSGYDGGWADQRDHWRNVENLK